MYTTSPPHVFPASPLGTAQLKGAGAKTVGFVSEDGYTFDRSKSLRYDETGERSQFCGLPLDEKNEPELTSSRIDRWLDKLKGEGFPLGCSARRRLGSEQVASEHLGSEGAWYHEWQERFTCWWSELTIHQRQQLSECKAAPPRPATPPKKSRLP